MIYNFHIHNISNTVKVDEYTPIEFKCFPVRENLSCGFSLKEGVIEVNNIYHDIIASLFNPKKHVRLSVVIEDEI